MKREKNIKYSIYFVFRFFLGGRLWHFKTFKTNTLRAKSYTGG